MPDALRPDQPHGLRDRVQEGLGGVVEQQVGLVEEEHQLRLVDVTDLGQLVEQVGQQPHQEGGEHRGPLDQIGQLQQRHHALAVPGHPQQIGRVELRLAEELVGALVGEGDQGAQDHPNRRRAQPADRLQLGLALVAGQVGEHRTQVLEVEQRQSGLVGVVENEPERGLLDLVQTEHLGQQHRPERAHRRPQRDPEPLTAEGEELGGAAPRLPVLTDLLGPREQLVVRLAG